MYSPITSEITLGTGTVLREISTGRLFEVSERLKPAAEVSGEDIWKITPITNENDNRLPRVLTRQELSERYFADTE